MVFHDFRQTTLLSHIRIGKVGNLHISSVRGMPFLVLQVHLHLYSSLLQVTGKKYPNMRHSYRHTKPLELPVLG